MSAQTRLRKSISTRFARSSHSSSPKAEPFDPELARLFATAAASRAMSRSLYRPSEPYDGSYSHLGGPQCMAVPPRRYNRSTKSSGYSDDRPIRHSVPSSVDSSGHDQRSSAALPSISEFGGLEDRIASLPSSYRRLRRSRSMFSTRQRSSHIPNTSRESYSPNLGKRGPPSDQPRLYRTLRRSMSFLRSDDRPRNTLRHAKSHDVAIQLARSQYEQDHLNSPDSSTWAPLPISKVRREHKPFRKTFRGISTSQDTTATDASIEPVRTSQSHGKARAFSSTIKKGIKRVLGLSRNVTEQGVAQASPSSSQWGQSPSTEISNDIEYSGGCGSSEVDNSHQQSSSRPPTVRRMQSSGSLATSRSRVTSWADSTAANTIATPNASGQRLSIISEQGILGPSDLYPIPSVSTQQAPSNAIDSHRLFSALMKRIGGANMQPTEEDIVVGQVKEHRAVPTQSSLRYQRSRQTIRQIPSDTSVSSPKSFATANPGPATPHEQPQTRASNVRSVIHPAGDYAIDNIVRKENLRPEPDSPSVYSRSTNGHSPRPKPNADSPDSASEPGLVTIYSSERTAYNSPSKLAAMSDIDTSTQTGTDWHNWMDSQMARIENVPSGHHYREDAQIQDDYDISFTSSVPTRRIRVESRGIRQLEEDRDESGRKVSTNSNFSRPFSRSSSLRTVVRIGNPSPNVPTISIPTLAADDVFGDSTIQDHFLKSSHAGQSTGVSPMLPRSSNQPRMADSRTPKRPSADVSPKMLTNQCGQYSARWSPGTDARTLHRRSARVLRESRRATNENAKLEQGFYDQAYGLQSPMSSKRMVEIFLNSRRRQMGADVPDDGASETAFP
ncbi:hypothetical protein BJY04DRAFT_13785 [Aspergillus karnatakaensis]|uniref:uncharacterized protein n=1 Tax=Aspergillus karnatakaensis TaxID=1810916 RepID=UPI003CCDF441